MMGMVRRRRGRDQLDGDGGGREGSSTSVMEGGNPTLEASVVEVLESSWVDQWPRPTRGGG